MLPLSVCIIAKNEEKYIEKCLSALAPYGFEIILTDTGSTDRTVAIAGKYTDKIYHFDWCDDFSAARNYAISRASNDLVLSLDCDEYLQTLDADALLQAVRSYPAAADLFFDDLDIADQGNLRYLSDLLTKRHALKQRFNFPGYLFFIFRIFAHLYSPLHCLAS